MQPPDEEGLEKATHSVVFFALKSIIIIIQKYDKSIDKMLRAPYVGVEVSTQTQREWRPVLSEKTNPGGYGLGRRTRKAISVTIPEQLLALMDAERRPKESRSQQMVRLTMKGLGLSAKEQLTIHESGQ